GHIQGEDNGRRRKRARKRSDRPLAHTTLAVVRPSRLTAPHPFPVFHSLSYFSRFDLRFAIPPDIPVVWSCGPDPARAEGKCGDRGKRRLRSIDSAASALIRA